MRLRRLTSLKFVGQAVTMEIQAGFLCYSLEAELFLFQELQKNFNCLDDAHPHCQGQSPLLKSTDNHICKILSQQHLN